MNYKPTNLIVLDEDGRVYYSAKEIVKGQVASVIDLFNNFIADESKAFIAKVKSIDDTEIEFDETKMEELKLHEQAPVQVKGTHVRNTTEAIGVITNALQKEGFAFGDFEIYQEKHKDNYYFAAFTCSEENIKNARTLFKDEMKLANQKVANGQQINLTSLFGQAQKIEALRTTERDYGSGDTFKWRMDINSKQLIADIDDSKDFYRDGADIAENGKKIDHQKIYQTKER